MKEIEEYVKERDSMFLKPLDEFIRWARGRAPFRPTSDEVYEITYHKCRTAAKSLPMEERSASKRWLLENNYTSFDDGDVPT